MKPLPCFLPVLSFVPYSLSLYHKNLALLETILPDSHSPHFLVYVNHIFYEGEISLSSSAAPVKLHLRSDAQPSKALAALTEDPLDGTTIHNAD